MAARLLGPSCAFAPRSRFDDIERHRVSALNGVLVVQSATIDDVSRAALECHNGRTTSTPIMVCHCGDLSTSSASVDGDAMMSVDAVVQESVSRPRGAIRSTDVTTEPPSGTAKHAQPQHRRRFWRMRAVRSSGKSTGRWGGVSARVRLRASGIRFGHGSKHPKAVCHATICR